MKLTSKSKKLDKLSDFGLDVSKGLMVAGILGQSFVETDSYERKILLSLLVITLSLLFLYFSLSLDKKETTK